MVGLLSLLHHVWLEQLDHFDPSQFAQVVLRPDLIHRTVVGPPDLLDLLVHQGLSYQWHSPAVLLMLPVQPHQVAGLSQPSVIVQPYQPQPVENLTVVVQSEPLDLLVLVFGQFSVVLVVPQFLSDACPHQLVVLGIVPLIPLVASAVPYLETETVLVEHPGQTFVLIGRTVAVALVALGLPHQPYLVPVYKHLRLVVYLLGLYHDHRHHKQT